MKAFRFRLDPVVAVRRFELDRARTELGEAERATARADERHQAWRERRTQSGEELAAAVTAGVRAGGLHSAAAALTSLAERVAEAEAGLAQARADAAERRQRALEARTRLRALERLRERAAALHRRDEARREQRDLDEIGALRAARDRRLS